MSKPYVAQKNGYRGKHRLKKFYAVLSLWKGQRETFSTKEVIILMKKHHAGLEQEQIYHCLYTLSSQYNCDLQKIKKGMYGWKTGY